MVLAEYISGHGLVLLLSDRLQVSVRLLVFGCDGELVLVLGFLTCLGRHAEELPGGLFRCQFWFLFKAADLLLLF